MIVMNKLEKLQKRKERLDGLIKKEQSKSSAQQRVRNLLGDTYHSGLKVKDRGGSQFEVLMEYNNDGQYLTYGLTRDMLEDIMRIASMSHLYADEKGIHLIFYN